MAPVGPRKPPETVERLWREEGLQLPQRHIEEDQQSIRGIDCPTNATTALSQGQFDHPVAIIRAIGPSDDGDGPRIQTTFGVSQVTPLVRVTLANDFVHDKLSNGRSYEMLTVLDEYTRQALAVNVGT